MGQEWLAKQHSDNMQFFERHHKPLYKLISQAKKDHCQLLVDEKSGDIDLKVNGELLYNGSAIKHVMEEFEAFMAECGPGSLQKTINLPTPGAFYLPRLAHQHLDRFVSRFSKSDYAQRPWKVPDHLPQLVIFGVGLGLHIANLLENVDIHELIIFEPDPTMWLMSTYVIDWSELVKRQSRPGYTLKLLFDSNPRNAFPRVWNALSESAPHFPFTTLFYNHRRLSRTHEIIRELRRDRALFMPMWGQYDDEINQMNHIFHNVMADRPKIPAQNQFRWEKPVMVVGAGPSLDRHVEDIKRFRDQFFLFSAGTAITSLLVHGITPDLHVESESDFNTYVKLVDLPNAEQLKDIPMVCAAQCSPRSFGLFGDSAIYFKDGAASGEVLEEEQNRLRWTSPTCTNAAMALAFHFRAPRVHLVGTDFGYYDKEYHHSKSSTYYDGSEFGQKLSADIEQRNKNTIIIEGYHGPLHTYVAFSRARMRAESDILDARRLYKIRVVNHSDGAIIPSAERVESLADEFTDTGINTEGIRSTSKILEEFMAKRRAVNANELWKLRDRVHEMIGVARKDLNDMLNKPVSDPDRFITTHVRMINSYIHATIMKRFGILHWLISGSIRQHLLVGLALILSADESRKMEIAEAWRDDLQKLLTRISENTHEILDKDFAESDTRLDYSIKKSLPEGLA